LNLPPDYARELEASRPQQYVPYVEWRRLPYQGRFINIDRAGLRRTLHSYCDDAKAPVIWIFGDSVTWGTGVTDGDTIASQLAALYEQAGQKACVVNYGEAGRVSTQEVLEFLLGLKHAERKPNVVVFYDGMSQVDPPLEGAPIDRHLAYLRFQDLIEESQRLDRPGLWFLTKTNTVRALRQIAENWSDRIYQLQEKHDYSNLPSTRADSAARDALSIYQQNMQLVNAVSQQYGFQSFFFWYPTRIASPKPLTREERMPRAEELSEDTRVIRDVYASFRTIHSANFFYLGDMFAGDTERLYQDDSHLTAKGYFLSAHHIFQTLQASQASSPP
jgi:lysophospholipase L1-like esterase